MESEDMETTTHARRDLRIRRAAAFALAALLAACAWRVADGQPSEELPGHDAPSAIELVPDDEPGEALIVRGQVFAPDGETPVEGVVLYVYQTGADGRYAPPGEEVPRLRGWVRTDREGRYEYRTIRPGQYPGRRTPAHIHAVLWGAGYPAQWGGDVLFADDPLLAPETGREAHRQGRFAEVCAPRTADRGELLCTRNYRLKTRPDPVPGELDHAFRPPRER